MSNEPKDKSNSNNDKTNGSSTSEIPDLLANERDWHIVRDAGVWLLGIPNSAWTKLLAPVFELHVQVQQQAGGVAVHDIAQPIMLMASMTTGWDLTPPVKSWPVRGCTREKEIRAAIERGEGMLRAIRAQASGLTVAKEMPKPGPTRRIQ